MASLIPVTKDGEAIAVHPTCLADHLRLGWREVPAEVAAPQPEPEPDPKPARRRKAPGDTAST